MVHFSRLICFCIIFIAHSLLANIVFSLNDQLYEPTSSSSTTSCTDCSNDLLQVEGCCCSISQIEKANKDIVYPLFEKIVKLPFFSHFKISLCSQCDLWQDSPLCMMRDCSVCECTDKDIPSFLKQNSENKGCEDQVDSMIQHSDNKENKITEEWSHNMEEEIVDLRLNPERYTGYNGESAEKVWTAVHDAKGKCCFSEEECQECEEKKAFNRLLSGMHTSISLHIAHDYCLKFDKSKVGECAIWGMNEKIAQERVLNHPNRIQNLYFAYAVLLRAVIKAGKQIAAAVPNTKDNLYALDLKIWSVSLFPEIENLGNSCPRMFDETQLFGKIDSKQLRLDIEKRTIMLNKIMKCVGCDRCKLWGTMQALGYSTALRVLYPVLEEENSAKLDNQINEYSLDRQEAVALVHTLERLSKSLIFLKDFKNTLSNNINSSPSKCVAE